MFRANTRFRCSNILTGKRLRFARATSALCRSPHVSKGVTLKFVMRKFLTAKWQDLIMANYEVSPDLLRQRVPAGTELDFHEGRCFVSLVGFMFLDTRVLGIPIPFHRDFEEINLRFYVKRTVDNEVRRGVVFIKEIVPKWAIAKIAKTIYGEPYETASMRNNNDAGKVKYSALKGKGRPRAERPLSWSARTTSRRRKASASRSGSPRKR